MKRLFLHVGFHKTASTSFQFTCSKHVDCLLEEGFLYPIFYCIEKPRTMMRNHSIPIFSLFSLNPGNPTRMARLGMKDIDRINHHFEKILKKTLSHSKDVIISGEGISDLPRISLDRLVSFISLYQFNINAIALVRSPYSYNCSALQEQIKQGQHVDFGRDFISQKQKIIRLRTVFGQNIRFYPFREACSHRFGPVGFLCEKIGCQSLLDQEFISANQGLGNMSTRIQNHLNKKHIKSHSLGIDDGKFLLTSHELTMISKRLEEENAFFKETLGVHFCDQDFPTSNELSPSDFLEYIGELYQFLGKPWKCR